MGGTVSRSGDPAHGSDAAPQQPPASPPRVQFNVYNQPIDPSNQMPVQPNQNPWPGQRRLLSTERQRSAIPKGGGGQWVFPSPQMFYNALMRKGKGGDVTEEDMDTVVAVHNGAWRACCLPPRWQRLTRWTAGMNQATWEQVQVWERLHREECGSPALLRFLGRPDSLSPRARMRKLFTGELTSVLPVCWWCVG